MRYSCQTERTLDLHPDDPTSRQVKAALHKFQQTTSQKVTLPLMELEAARDDMEEFMWSCLQEISSQTVLGTNWRTLPEVSCSHQQGMRTGPSSGTRRGRGVPTSPDRASGPSTSQG